MRTWIEFWNSEHAIYVNARHKQVHAEMIARDLARHIPSRDAAVLDHGCGEALYVEEVAAGCGRLILCEAAEKVRARLIERTAGTGNVVVIDAAGVERLPDASLDLVVANSLVQYLTREELAGLLDLWRQKLAPGGALVIADVIPPDVSPLTDALALLRLGWRAGFLPAALAGLVRTALSDYGRIRKELGFATYTEAELLRLLAEHGFAAQRIHPNFGHNQARMAFRAAPA